jgi:hypothetical protein
VFQYPNAFTGDNKKTCNETLEDVALGFMPGALRLGITAYEANWIQSFAGPTLHNAIRVGTASAGFEFVEGPWEAFKGHGYCASDQQRWFNRATESNAHQGPSLGDTKGTIHPSSTGYYELSKFIVSALTAKENNARPRPLSDKYVATPGKLLKVDVLSGVLSNDNDTDILGTLTVKSFTQPSSKVSKVQVSPDGSFVYNAAGFSGKESFFYTVTDGISEAIGRVEITVPASAPSNGGTTIAPTMPTIKRL